jgi:hypothetical protein
MSGLIRTCLWTERLRKRDYFKMHCSNRWKKPRERKRRNNNAGSRKKK